MESNIRKTGLFRSALDSLVEARSRQAARYVNTFLLSMDDETLAAHGYSRAELQKLGQTGFAY